MNLIHFKALLEKYKAGRLTPGEADELRNLVKEGSHDALMQEDILYLLQQMGTNPQWTPDMQEQTFRLILQNKELKESADNLKIRRLPYYIKWMAAAVVAGLLLTTSWLLLQPKEQVKPVVASTQPPPPHDVAPPDATHAVITLANGQQIILDSTGAGTLATQGDVQLVKLADGQITYTGNSGEVMYNTLSNPRGSKVINLALSDGTKIWLNSESSLRYPTAFTGKERSVEITGEAYFEVAKDPSKKFIVSSRGIRTEVLGTHFNVNAYMEIGRASCRERV